GRQPRPTPGAASGRSARHWNPDRPRRGAGHAEDDLTGTHVRDRRVGPRVLGHDEQESAPLGEGYLPQSIVMRVTASVDRGPAPAVRAVDPDDGLLRVVRVSKPLSHFETAGGIEGRGHPDPRIQDFILRDGNIANRRV